MNPLPEAPPPRRNERVLHNFAVLMPDCEQPPEGEHKVAKCPLRTQCINPVKAIQNDEQLKWENVTTTHVAKVTITHSQDHGEQRNEVRVPRMF
mmetsp:Transcript_10158/g.17715  ORF Transcript_10158/g.17715 Transcript_10158/m.17715 type:complete len:94 (+) Transcript_10158:118-399(+)